MPIVLPDSSLHKSSDVAKPDTCLVVANDHGDLPAIGVGVRDFTGVPLADGADTSLDATLQYNAAHVTIQACQKCHGELMQGTQHGNYWADTRVCVMCHNPFYFPGMETDKALFEQWAHEIHNGQIQGRNDVSEVVFPQPINNCVVCHQDFDSLTAGTNADMDAWKTMPNATACTSCHETVNPLNVDVYGVVDGVSTLLAAGTGHAAGGWAQIPAPFAILQPMLARPRTS
jgi:OmcA/MtrC family decaheme c-type cytochrome